MQFSPPGDLEGFRGVSFLYPQGYVRVQLPEKTVTEMAAGDIFPFLSCKGGVIDNKMHGNGRLRNFLERDGGGMIRGAEGIADMEVGNTGNGNNRAGVRFLDVHFI
ncbi:hypothetical protein IMSAGC019_03227 [Lachnospiraceae bacterium]|nr:hypothetical protein IMSAGC019_03227 [Lachnospiraceae bacterium]